jgi:3-hydroxybutyryl-CoA dehydrogenase
MQIVVLTNGELKKELLNNADGVPAEVFYIEEAGEFEKYPQADAFIDLLFQPNHLPLLQKLLPSLVIINSVEHLLAETDPSFVRINGWPSLLQSSLVEACSFDEDRRKKTEQVFSFFNKQTEWMGDLPGFVTPRIISMIVNEAFFLLQEAVSTREEINTAMKLGTNYPYGPFEWAEKIGAGKIASLLNRLGKEQPAYLPNPLLVKAGL